MATDARERQRSALLPEIDFRTGRGLLQIFGGINQDLSARSRVLLVVRADGDAVESESPCSRSARTSIRSRSPWNWAAGPPAA